MLTRLFVAIIWLFLVDGVQGRVKAGEPPLPPAVKRPALAPYLAQLQPTAPLFLEQELSLPANGVVRKETKRQSIAPFRIMTSGSSNYLVKLFDEDTAQSKRPKSVLSVFVRAGKTADVKVPLGTYVIRYAGGEKWYGYKHLFGPNTSYSEANEAFRFRQEGNRVSGYSITLYAVPGGNLKTSGSTADSFGD